MQQALLVTNLAARSVSQRVKDVIVKALSADLKLEVAETTGRNHATELARDAADRGFDLVISFGGDGTMNEVVNGLVGTETALTILPGGMANVLCRVLGIPTDIVEATGDLLNRVKSGSTRKINIGKTNDRYFVLSCGAGLDAATVKKVESNPAAKKKWKDWFFVSSALSTAFKEYRGRAPYIRMSAADTETDVVLAIVCKTPEFTFFKRWPVKIAPDARLDAGFDVISMERVHLWFVPKLVTGIFATGGHTGSSQVTYVKDVDDVVLTSAGDPFPVQVDGEYVGDETELRIGLVRDGLILLD